MKKKLVAVLAAMTLCITLCPVYAGATEVDDNYEDMIDDGAYDDEELEDDQEEGEQTTEIAPGAEDDTDTAPSTGDDHSSNNNSDNNTNNNNTNNNNTNNGTANNSTQNTKTSDSSLSRLGISPGQLVPAFSPNVYNYTVNVGADVKSVSVPATPSSSKAVIAAVTGAKSLTPGANTVKVVVEAENGATSTYTITVNCGEVNGTAAQSTGNDSVSVADEIPAIEGEIIDGAMTAESEATDTAETKPGKKSKVTFDENGYLVYEGNSYIPSEMMPDGEYVALEKYNILYEQVQSEKSKYTRALLVLVLIVLVLLIVILNLVLKLRDMKQDARLGLLGYDDGESDRLIRTREDKKQTKAVKPVKAEKAAKTEKTVKTVKATKADKPEMPVKAIKTTSPAKQVKTTKSKSSADAGAMDSTRIPDVKISDLEIMDLNDL